MKRIHVQPSDIDRRVPTNRTPGEYFPHGEATEVVLDRYIQRRLDDGDLIEVDGEGATVNE